MITFSGVYKNANLPILNKQKSIKRISAIFF